MMGQGKPHKRRIQQAGKPSNSHANNTTTKNGSEVEAEKNRKPRTVTSNSMATNANLETTSNSSKGQAKNDPNSQLQAVTSSSMAVPLNIDGAATQSSQRRKPSGTSNPSSQQSSSQMACMPSPANSHKNPSSRTSNSLSSQKEQTSFSNHVIIHTVDTDNAIDSDSEGGCIDESAIDDEDDSSDWEDLIEDSGKSSVDDKYFQRVDSKVNLTSRRSLITLMLTQTEDRAKALSNHASQSTSAIPQSRNRNGPAFAVSPNDSDDAPLMMKGNRQPPLKPIREIPRSSAQPIPTAAHSNDQGALSPRTTRRNMVATELTESLRRHLLWERSQKSSTANAVLKRRHTSHDVANLKQFPEKSCMKKTEDINASAWNQFFTNLACDGYHSKGW
ncbi:unnamed protein product [Clonostachys chloroleuca]|uniref:DUF3295 domain-containing protein n=1 Tax=Clonostachys chloroleuca TaxID=1926264 RepID=A0AA35Q021_9HYPO|nr:unnamed protein product [Clonostachys chloroleuca]